MGDPSHDPSTRATALAVALAAALIAVPTASAAWPTLAEARIRPGVSIAGGCTAAFVFSDAANETLYISSASHCFPGDHPGDSVEVAGIGGAGTIAYCSWRHTEDYDECADGGRTVDDANDFALVRIDDAHRDDVHPAVRFWGGPTGMAGETELGDRMLTYGVSGLHPDLTNDREGYEMDTLDGSDWTTEGYFLHPSVPGDSGSPAMAANGTALGVLSYLSGTGHNGFSNLRKAVPFAEDKMGVDLQLKTWEQFQDPRLPAVPEVPDLPDLPGEDDAGSGGDAPDQRTDDVRVDPGVRYQGNLTGREDDWYAFEADAGRTLHIHTYGTVQHWIQVVDPSGDQRILGGQLTPTQSTTPTNLTVDEGGTWYLHLFGRAGDHYRFSFDFDEHAPDPSPIPEPPEAPGLPGP